MHCNDCSYRRTKQVSPSFLFIYQTKDDITYIIPITKGVINDMSWMCATIVVVVVSLLWVSIFLILFSPPVSMSSDAVTSFERLLVDEALLDKKCFLLLYIMHHKLACKLQCMSYLLQCNRGKLGWFLWWFLNLQSSLIYNRLLTPFASGFWILFMCKFAQIIL